MNNVEKLEHILKYWCSRNDPDPERRREFTLPWEPRILGKESVHDDGRWEDDNIIQWNMHYSGGYGDGGFVRIVTFDKKEKMFIARTDPSWYPSGFSEIMALFDEDFEKMEENEIFLKEEMCEEHPDDLYGTDMNCRVCRYLGWEIKTRNPIYALMLVSHISFKACEEALNNKLSWDGVLVDRTSL